MAASLPGQDPSYHHLTQSCMWLCPHIRDTHTSSVFKCTFPFQMYWHIPWLWLGFRQVRRLLMQSSNIWDNPLYLPKLPRICLCHFYNLLCTHQVNSLESKENLKKSLFILFVLFPNHITPQEQKQKWRYCCFFNVFKSWYMIVGYFFFHFSHVFIFQLRHHGVRLPTSEQISFFIACTLRFWRMCEWCVVA